MPLVTRGVGNGVSAPGVSHELALKDARARAEELERLVSAATLSDTEDCFSSDGEEAGTLFEAGDGGAGYLGAIASRWDGGLPSHGLPGKVAAVIAGTGGQHKADGVPLPLKGKPGAGERSNLGAKTADEPTADWDNVFAFLDEAPSVVMADVEENDGGGAGGGGGGPGGADGAAGKLPSGSAWSPLGVARGIVVSSADHDDVRSRRPTAAEKGKAPVVRAVGHEAGEPGTETDSVEEPEDKIAGKTAGSGERVAYAPSTTSPTPAPNPVKRYAEDEMDSDVLVAALRGGRLPPETFLDPLQMRRDLSRVLALLAANDLMLNQTVAHYDQLQRELAEAGQERAVLENTLRAAQEHVVFLEETSSGSPKDLEALRGRALQLCSVEVEQLRLYVAARDETIRQLKRQLRHTSAERSHQVVALENEIDRLNQELAKLQILYAANGRKGDRLSAELTLRDTDFGVQMQTLRQQLEVEAAKAAALAAKNADLEGTVERLRDHVAAAEAAAREAQRARVDLERTRQAQEDEVLAARTAVDRLQAHVDDLASGNAAVTRLREDAAAERERFEACRARLEMEVADLRRVVAERDNGRRVGGSAETADASVQTSAALVPWPTDDAFDPAPGADADADADAAAAVVADDSVEFELARVGQGTGSSGVTHDAAVDTPSTCRCGARLHQLVAAHDAEIDEVHRQWQADKELTFDVHAQNLMQLRTEFKLEQADMLRELKGQITQLRANYVAEKQRYTKRLQAKYQRNKARMVDRMKTALVETYAKGLLSDVGDATRVEIAVVDGQTAGATGIAPQ